MLYRITWININTGAHGHGDYVFTYENALRSVIHYNREFEDTGFFHFFEQEFIAPLPVDPPVDKKVKVRGGWGGA